MDHVRGAEGPHHMEKAENDVAKELAEAAWQSQMAASKAEIECDSGTDLVDRIEAVRQNNNTQWMNLLRLALEAEPSKAKAILLKIKRNDSEIQRLLGELASD